MKMMKSHSIIKIFHKLRYLKRTFMESESDEMRIRHSPNSACFHHLVFFSVLVSILLREKKTLKSNQILYFFKSKERERQREKNVKMRICEEGIKKDVFCYGKCFVKGKEGENLMKNYLLFGKCV